MEEAPRLSEDTSSPNGITHSGRSTEHLFCRLTGAALQPVSSGGDAAVSGHLVELKYASSAAINQVRAGKYIPVIIHTPTGRWYVVPPNAIVAAAAQRKRGQHGENPFENFVLNIHTLAGYEVDESDLKQAVLDAVAEGECWPELRREMERQRTLSSAVAASTRLAVLDILQRGPTTTPHLPNVALQLHFDSATDI